MNKSRGRVRAGFRSTAVLMAFAFVAVLTGFGGSQPVLASVLPPEQSAFGLEPADSDLPDAEGRRYVSVADPFQGTTEADDCALVRGGELVKLFNTEADVCIRPVVVSGRTVVFEKGHENGLWDRYHEDKRLKALEIHAEVVEIRTPMVLPQTDLTIYARQLSFVDANGVASLSTKPIDWTTDAEKGVAGAAGHDGGDISLVIRKLTAAKVSEPRFKLNGGRGQNGGAGTQGGAGKTLGVVPEIAGKFCLIDGYSGWTFSGTPVTYASYRNRCGTNTKGSTATNNGAASKPGGRAGDASDSGQFTSTLDLSALVQALPGKAGTRPFTQGGARGNPTSYRHVSCTNSSCTSTYKSSSLGASATGPAAAKPEGQSKPPMVKGQKWSWMSPPVLNQMLRYAKEAYLYGHLDYVATTLKAYIQWMKAYRNAPEWNDLDDQQQADVLAVKDESVSLYQQLRSNQDYFGNPVGWVPMLSFEVNQAAFEQEVDRAMDILYLTYSLGGGARTLQQQKETAQTLKEKLEEEVISAKAEYNETVRSVPGLQAEIDRISQGISIAKRDIQTLRDELLRQAKDAAFIRSIGNTLIKVSEVIPATQPLLSFTGNVIAGIPDIDPNAPLERTLVGVAKNSAGEALKQYQTQMIDQQLADADELANCSLPPKACLALLGAKKANELRGPLNNVLDRTTELFIERSAPSPEVEAELDRILADEPRFAAIIARLEKLNAQKADFAVRYMETMTKINRLATQITQSMLSISVLHGVIRDVLSVLDPAVVAHVADMQQRARHRLQLYQYYMVKAYEYRLIKPYSGDRDINALFDDVCKLATAVKENDLGEGLSGDGCGNNSAPVLSKDDFDTLKGLFDDQIGEVVFEILDGYNSGTAPQERSRSVPVASARLVPVINQLNVRQEPKLNLYELGLFPGSRENLRLTGVRVTNVEFEYIGARSDVTEIDICFRHSGTTRLRQDGETYLFRHYNERTRSPIQWCSQYVPQTASLNQILPSAAQASLLRAQLGSAGSQDTLLLFSRPGAWADLSVTMEVNAFGNSTARIKRMDLEASYDYVDKASGHVLLEVRPENPALSPLIKLSNLDRNGRKDGQGSFDRSFNPGAQVTIEAPQRYGSWVFAGWAGASNSTANRIAVPLNRDASLQARYVKGAGPGPIDTDRDGIPDDTDPDDDNDGMTDVWERAYGLNPLDSGDAAIDSDSDGVSNLSESRIGTSPIVPQAAPRDGVGVFNPNTAVFKLRNALSAGAPDALFRYGTLGVQPLVGNWNGQGGDSIGLFKPSTARFWLKNVNRQGPSEIVTIFGQAGWVGLAGDWNGDGITTIGVYNPAKRRFFLRDNNVSGKASAIFQFGASANWIPLVGDWDGNGTDTIGQFNPDNGRVFLKNTNGPGAHDVTFVIQDAANQIPVVGDWNGDGIDNVGVYNARSGAFALRSSNTDGPVDIYFPFGGPGMVPLRGGNWSGIR